MKAWLQISSGRGPVECCWAVARTLAEIQREAKDAGLNVTVLEATAGPATGTLMSALVAIEGADAGVQQFAQAWEGSILWTGQSRFRPHCRRRNFFIGVRRLAEPENLAWRQDELRFETMLATGPGGQHVNKTETAVRVVHLPTGISAFASEERSQYQNKRLALARLATHFNRLNRAGKAAAREVQWLQHWQVESGNPVRIYTGDDFRRDK